ncbi:MAG: hypothetical protein FD130_1608 [Halothiobacillaceae bacterium]|nr:MAG: hypothetical protein FD130_1608 [Halothiobacillaceae bacterium]
MKVFTYSEARQNLSDLLIIAQKEEVEIRRKIQEWANQANSCE